MKILLISLMILFVIPCNGQQRRVFVMGKIENAKDNWLMFYKNQSNVLSGNKDRTRFKAIINQQGEFKISLPVTEISEWVIEIDGKTKVIDLKANTNFSIIIVANNDYDIKVFDEFGNDFNFQQNTAQTVAEKFPYEKLQLLSPLEALAFRKEKSAFKLSLLTDYQKNHKMDKDYVAWLRINDQYEPYERNLVEDGIKPDSLMMLTLTEKGINNDFAALNSESYHILIERYIHYKFNKLTFPVKKSDLFNVGINNLNGLTKQVYLTRMMISLIKSPDSIYNPIYLKYKNEVINETLISLVKKERDAYKLALSASSMSKENITAYTSLNEIFSKYKGKVIYVDFWASWCGPCKSEMPKAASLKEKLKGKDIVFLYFGYKDEKADWLASKKELQIDGEHYLLSKQLISEANSIFNIRGIPHYAIINKQGRIIETLAPRPSYVYEQLLRLAENK